MRTLLVTGFEPFGGADRNASWEAVRRLDGRVVERRAVAARQLPTEFERAPRALLGLVSAFAPELVLCVGQAAGRRAIALERRYHNQADTARPDNAGLVLSQARLVDDGPEVHAPRAPIDELVEELRARGIAAEPSDDAGRFVCNATAYRLAHALAGSDVGHCFVHVPALPSDDGHGMSTDDVERALVYVLGRWVRSFS